MYVRHTANIKEDIAMGIKGLSKREETKVNISGYDGHSAESGVSVQSDVLRNNLALYNRTMQRAGISGSEMQYIFDFMLRRNTH